MISPPSLIDGSICKLKSSASSLLIVIPLSRIDTSIWVVILSKAMHFIFLPIPLIELLSCCPFELVGKDELSVALLYFDAFDDLPVALIDYSIQILESSIPYKLEGLWLRLRLLGDFLCSFGILFWPHCITASIISNQNIWNYSTTNQ
jgi:hypothetical protein